MLTVLAEALTPEVQFVRESARSTIKAALRTAFRKISPADRSLLRLRYLSDLKLVAIAKIHQIAISTAKNRLDGLHRQIRKDVLLELKHLGLSPTELESLIAAGQSQFDVNLASLLREHQDP